MPEMFNVEDSDKKRELRTTSDPPVCPEWLLLFPVNLFPKCFLNGQNMALIFREVLNCPATKNIVEKKIYI